jgi:hypothetical protein
LTSLARKNLSAFILPRLDGYSSADVGNSSLANIDAVPFLFHSGYLTIDRASAVKEARNGVEEAVSALSLKIPNVEVGKRYNDGIFIDSFKPRGKCSRALRKGLRLTMERNDALALESLTSYLLEAVQNVVRPASKQFRLSEKLAGFERAPKSETSAARAAPTAIDRYYLGIIRGALIYAGVKSRRRSVGHS